LPFRRPHGLGYVKTKLLSLDFILQNPANSYLATEQEKLDYFVHQLNIPPPDLPAKIYRSVKAKTETVRSCAEVKLLGSLGYGSYEFVVRDVSQLEPATVAGLFTWDDLEAGQNHREIDIEVSQWG
jgi:hypothetical protein